MYYEGLSELPGDFVLKAVQDLIFNDPEYEKYRPKVGAIKRRAKELKYEFECERDGINPETGHRWANSKRG